MTLRVRPILFASLLLAAGNAFATAAEAKPDAPRDETKAAEPAKTDPKPAEPCDRPAQSEPNGNDAPSAPPAAAPSRDAAKPARPANKQRPAWPPPPELIA